MSAVLDNRTRAVERVATSQVAPVGTFTVRRALPDRQRHSVGPWVFLDHFGPYQANGKDGVGPHPHAGIETVTYLLSGRNRHRDSAGHEGVVTAGGAQWMTAGRGVVHSEYAVPETEAERTVHGVQLWTSLPRLLKLTQPGYQRIAAEDIPEVAREGVRLRVVAGTLAGATGPATIRMPLVLAHATLAPGARFASPVSPGFEMAGYVIAGSARFGEGAAAAAGELAIFADGEGEIVVENVGTQPLEVMLLGGTPAEGPLVFHGPFVMNSIDQVRAADVASRTGRMGSLDE